MAALYDVATGRLVRTFAHTAAIENVGFAASGRLVMVQVGTTINFWDRRTGEYVLGMEQGYLLAMSADGALLALRGFGSTSESHYLRLASFDWSAWDARPVTPLVLGTAVESLVPRFQWADYQVRIGAGQSVVVVLTPLDEAGGLSLYANPGEVPSLATAAFAAATRTVRGTYELLIGPAQHPRDLYVGVFGVGVAGGERRFRVVARVVGRHLSDLVPRTAGNAGASTLHIAGLGFEPGMRVELHRAGVPVIVATAVTQRDVTALEARFTLRDMAPGSYDLTLIWPDGARQTAPGAFTIATGVGAQLVATLDVPDVYRADRPATAWLSVANTGDADMVAPLLILTSTPAAPMRTDCDSAFNTGGTVYLLGSNLKGPAGILPPGTTRQLAVAVEGPNGTVRFDYSVMQASDLPVAWESYRAGMRPATILAADWDALWPALKTRLGTTWADYLRVLGANAEILRQQGRPSECVQDLLALEVGKARGDPDGTIAGRLIEAETGSPLLGAQRLRAEAVMANCKIPP